MRLTSWNCLHGRPRERLDRLLSLESDIVVLQECRRPAAAGRSLWSGIPEKKGVLIAPVGQAVALEPVCVQGLPPTVLPVVVHATTPFILIGMWAQKEISYAHMALASLRPILGGVHGLPLVVAGDFNVSPLVIGQRRQAGEFFREMREEFGLVSAYHVAHDVEPGAELHPTFYMNGRQDRPFHLDYCFVPESWTGRIRDVRVGSYAGWQDSDHRPVTVDFAQA